jgi:hypothetical protein
MDGFIAVTLLAILVQFLVDRIKGIIPVTKIWKIELAPIYSLIFGIVLAFVAKIDLMAALGLQSITTIGYIVTGIAISGGAGALHELIASVRENRLSVQMNTLTSLEESTKPIEATNTDDKT